MIYLILTTDYVCQDHHFKFHVWKHHLTEPRKQSK